ncbi:ester cyclase [Amycolatopsis sp. ATCC 39116]|uniref:ester cyclase n=1 Tax=Amycolatopsis sp. (strain ATCC 39116 / 75iv2) TaxID=385957 RepID=UPI00031F9014|nr:ester cyclase [Amycolatopsis sp. ATCC 39116]
MYARMNTLIGDPARIDEVTHYLETTVRPFVEAQAGNRGLAVLTDNTLGITVVGSYWDSAESMTLSEHAVEASRKEAAELADGMITVDHFEVAVFARRSRPGPGAGIRMTTIDCPPGEIGAAVQAFRETALPGLMKMDGLCSAQMLVDREQGRCQVIAAYETAEHLAASRAGVARLRADTLARIHAQVRSVGEYRLLFTTVREGGTNSLTQRWTDLWNAGDREGWQAMTDQSAFEMRAPGGFRLAGREALDAEWSTWHDAFPDNRVTVVAIYGDDNGGVLEGRFQGTHTGPLVTPAGEIAPTERTVDIPFCEVHRVGAGKMTDSHLYFDQLELLTQLGKIDT